MKITCPCNMIAEPKMINGVIEYIHKDGASCKVLNRFYTDKCESYVWDICKQAIEDEDYDTFNVYMFIVTKHAINRILRYVAFASKSELIKILMFLFSTTKIRKDLQATLARELIKNCGKVAYDNINAIMGDSLSEKRTLSTISYSKLVKSSMCDVSNDIRITSNSTKQNIVEDLARSFLIDKSIKDASLKQALSKMSRH